MVQIELTSHLYSFFPHLRGQDIALDVPNVKALVAALDRLAPGLAFYLCDELGSLREHVNIFIGDERLVDRKGLTDRLEPGVRVTVMQALSGG